MNRAAAVAGSVLIALGLSIFAWKTMVLQLPVLPSDVENLWRVELEIVARGSGQRGSVRAAVPSPDEEQEIFDERQTSDRLVFTVRTENGQRTGVWSGKFDDVHSISYAFRVQIADSPLSLPVNLAEKPPKDLFDTNTKSTARFPVDAPEIRELVASIAPPAPSDPLGQMRTLLGYVTDEILTVNTGSDDALLTLAASEGSQLGKARLLVTLLRAAGFPARLAAGLRLKPGKDAKETIWAEGWVGGRFLPLSPTLGFFGSRPPDLLLLKRGGGASLVDETGLDAVSSRFRVLRESLRPEEVASFMVSTNPLLAAVSLYRLPVGSQSALRILLVFPLGALVIAVFRNLVGLRTFGTFMPLLVALALRELSLSLGLSLVGSVIALGIVSRLFLDRLQLLLVPRLGVLLCVVVLAITAQSVIGRGYEVKDLFASVLFPVVILTMMIERFSITTAEEGLGPAVRRLATSTLIAVCIYPIFRIAVLEHLMFGFPELVISIMGILVLIGGYSGYRLAELWRFRSFSRGPDERSP